MNTSQPLKILRKTEVAEIVGLSLTSIYYRTKEGLFPPAISLGARSVGYLQHEVDALITAQAAGATEEEIRILIDNLKVDRNQTAKKLGLSAAREEV